MGLDFEKILKEQLDKGKDENGDNSSSDTLQRKENQLQTINSKTPFFYARVLPLGENQWFAKVFETIFVDFTKKSGEVKQIPVIIDSKNPDDKIAKLAHRVISTNYKNRQESGDKDAKDIVTLNSRNKKFQFRIKNQVEIVGIPMVQQKDKRWGMAKRSDGTYFIKNYIIPWSSYQSILELMADSTQVLQDGTPFDTPLGFVTTGSTFPLGIKFNKSDNHYITGLRGQIQLPSVDYNYLEKDTDGNFKEFDNPEIFDQPLLKTNKDFYTIVLSQLTESVNKQLGNSEESSDDVNPFEEDKSVQENPFVANDNSNSNDPFADSKVMDESKVDVPDFNLDNKKEENSKDSLSDDKFEDTGNDDSGVPDIDDILNSFK